MRRKRTPAEAEIIKIFPKMLKRVMIDKDFSARITNDEEEVTVIVIKLNKTAAANLIEHLNSERDLYPL